VKNRSSNSVSVLMVGIGGYGYYYLKNLIEYYDNEKIEIVGVVDTCPDSSGLFSELKSRGISIFRKVEDFYRQGGNADLVVISSPLHYHVEQSCIALENESNVLCDKPLSPVIQDVDKLLVTRKKSKNWVMIGYQWSYSKAIQELKKDIISGQFGKPLRAKSLCFWPRNKTYYERNKWAGKKRDQEGRWILDSPLGNAMAHFIHNIFYLLGQERYLSAQPDNIQGECYRVYPIKNYDTGVFRAFTSQGVEVLFYGSHVTEREKGPMFKLEFENANITFGDGQDQINAIDNNGIQKNYGSPEDDDQFFKLHEAISAVQEEKPIVCGPEASTAQVLCINGLQDSTEKIIPLPSTRIRSDNNNERLWFDGLDEELYDCYRKNILPSESNLPWAVSGKKVDLRNYSWFPGGEK